MHGKRPLSPAAIGRFDHCRRWFWFQDVEGRQGVREQTVPLAVGNAAHAALFNLFQLPADERSVDALAAALRSCWRTRCPRELFTSRYEEAAYGRECLEWLERYATSTDLAAEVVALECRLNATLPHGGKVWGRIDRIDRLPDGRFRVIDYKTGQRRLAEDDLRVEPAAQIYLLLASQQLGEVESVRFLYLASGEEIAWAPEPEDVPFIAEAVAAHIDGIWLTEEMPPAQPGPYCSWCPFVQTCRAEDLRQCQAA